MQKQKEEEKKKCAEKNAGKEPQKEEVKKKDARDEKIEELEKKSGKLSEDLAREKDDYLRLMAEFETFRRRSAEERLALVGTASAETIKGMLPILDDCERALELLEKSSDKAAKEGTELIFDKLFSYLKSKGLERIKAKGEKFDTDFHEAVTQFPTEDSKKKGVVIDVIQTGYLLNGKVLRYAKVIVGA
ncbi:MAG: nucleotide exchange factor GrpE [Bacteroidales bacterium]